MTNRDKRVDLLPQDCLDSLKGKLMVGDLSASTALDAQITEMFYTLPDQNLEPDMKNSDQPCCARGECIVGNIAGREVASKDWRRLVEQFEGKIELWNELTKYRAIPHIGFVQPYKFCTQCGTQVALPPSYEDLQNLAGELYQILGALGAPANVLDNVSAASGGEPLPHKSLLPFILSDEHPKPELSEVIRVVIGEQLSLDAPMLLSKAAKAMGHHVITLGFEEVLLVDENEIGRHWNPLANDGDCARMELECGLLVCYRQDGVSAIREGIAGAEVSYALTDGDKHAARRLASVYAASQLEAWFV